MSIELRPGVFAIAVVMGFAAGSVFAEGPCSATALTEWEACGHEASDDFFIANAVCLNIVDREERVDCFREARVGRRERNQLCRGQLRARRDLCRSLGEDRYDPDFDPAVFDFDFANLTNPNPYFPLGIGNRWEFAGTEVVKVEVLAKTKQILGVTCIVVNDRVERGREGAQAGTAFLAAPAVGKVYRQEFSPGNAEDIAVVLSTTYAFGSDATLDQHVPQALAELLCAAHDCVVTGESTPIDPAGFERKYYARGVGLFLGIHPASGELVQLVSCNVDTKCATLPPAVAAPMAP